MTLPNIIFTGGMGAGKTWAADELARVHGYTRLSLATPVKEEAARRLGRAIDKGTDRGFLQEVGAEGRAKDPDYWVHQLLSKLADDQSLAGPWVVDDVRFLNEAALLRAHGFRVVQVRTPQEVCIARVTARDGRFDPAWLQDRSEQEWKRIEAEDHISGTGRVGHEVVELLWRLGGGAQVVA